jgi:hypothetical protein
VCELRVITIILAALTIHTYAATPQAVAIQVVGFAAKKTPIVVRTNVTGRYAAVLTAGGAMEGSAVTSPILIEQFSFGWQALELLNFRCRLEAHGLSRQIEDMLLHGMPQPRDDRPCGEQPRDAGPAADVEALRRVMRGPLVPDVIVSRDWAIGDWYGAGGGQTLFHRKAGSWHRVRDGGGAMDFGIVRAFGVPYADACKFQLYNAKCPY